jgi:hypothetical protein
MHVDNLLKNIELILFILRKLLLIVNVKMLQMVYFAHFYSQISCIIFCGSSSSVRNVSIIQIRAFGIMLKCFRNSQKSNVDCAQTGSKEFL